LEILFRSLSSSPACLLCFPRRPTVPRRPPPLWAGRRPTPVSPPPHASPLDPWTHFPRALELPPFATPPRTISRSPPRRRRGPAKTHPQSSISRAQPQYKYPRELHPSFFCQFPTPRARNAAAAHIHADELTLAVEPRLRSSSARANPLTSSDVSPCSCSTAFPRPNPTGTTPRAVLRALTAAARRGPTSSDHLLTSQGCPEVRVGLLVVSPNPNPAAGDSFRRIWAGHPLSVLFPTARDPELELGKAQGAVCEALDSEE
jgi:hypothetical protein